MLQINRDQVLPDNLEPGQLGSGYFTGRRHLIPHPAGKRIALLLELVQQRLHPLCLLGHLRRGEHPGGAVGQDQPQLPELRGHLVPLHKAGHRRPPLRILFGQQCQGRPSPVPGDDHISPALRRPHPDRLLEATQLNICG